MLRRSPVVRTILCLLTAAGSTAAVSSVAWAATPAKPLPVATWRKAANDICRQSEILLDDLSDEVFAALEPDGQPSVELMTTYVGELEPVVQQQIDSIDALREPKNLRKKVRVLLRTAREELDALVADPSIGLEANPFGATELAARKLKLKQCA